MIYIQNSVHAANLQMLAQEWLTSFKSDEGASGTLAAYIMSQQDKLRSWLVCAQCVHETGEKYAHDADGFHIVRENIRDVYNIDGLDRDRLTPLKDNKTETRPAAVANDNSPVSAN